MKTWLKRDSLIQPFFSQLIALPSHRASLKYALLLPHQRFLFIFWEIIIIKPQPVHARTESPRHPRGRRRGVWFILWIFCFKCFAYNVLSVSEVLRRRRGIWAKRSEARYTLLAEVAVILSHLYSHEERIYQQEQIRNSKYKRNILFNTCQL